jgi:hypothetical protein
MKFDYSKIKWSNLSSTEYSTLEWKCMKIFFAYQFFLFSNYILYKFNSIPYPVGIYRLVGHSYFPDHTIKICISVFVVILLALYIADIKMIVCTLLLFVISVLIFSIGESNGMWGRNGLLSIIFMAQFIAYIFHYYGIGRSLNRNRVQFSLQAIAAVYTLAAISKINTSGINWLIDSPNLALQVLKSFSYEYVTTGDVSYQVAGLSKANWIIQHPLLTKILLGGSLLLEAFSFLILINKKWAFFYGLLLLSMHVGIKVFLDLFFPCISMPMVAFCINPLYLAIVLIMACKSKMRNMLYPDR